MFTRVITLFPLGFRSVLPGQERLNIAIKISYAQKVFGEFTSGFKLTHYKWAQR